MRRGAAVSVDDNLSARQTRVAIWSADEESTGRVDMLGGGLGDPIFGKSRTNKRFDDRADTRRIQ